MHRAWLGQPAADRRRLPSFVIRGTIDAVTAPTTEPGPGPTPSAPVAPAVAHTHPCVRCGAPVPLDVGLCERCNPLGLKDASASQAHGTVVIAIVLAVVGLALFGRMALAGVGPFPATFVSAASDGDGLAITVTVTNEGSGAGQTTCRVTDPVDRNSGRSGFVLSPRIEPGRTVTFTKRVTELGSEARDMTVACRAP